MRHLTPIKRVRALGVAMILAGVAALVVVPAIDLPGRVSSGRTVLHEFSTTMSPRGLVALKTNFAMIDAFGTQFVTQTLPGVQRQLAVSRPQLDTLLRTKFPAVWAGVEEIPGALNLVRPVIPRIEAIGGDFQTVSKIPGFGLPLRSVTWIVLLLGAGLLVVGVALLVRPGRLTLAAALAAGALIVALPLAMDLPARFEAGSRMVDVGNIALSQKAATVALATTRIVDRLVPQVEHSLIPALASAAHQTPTAYTRALAARYPAVARGLEEWPSVRGPGYALAGAQQASVKPFSDIASLPLTTLPWLVIGPGAALALVALVLLVGQGRAPRSRAEEDELRAAIDSLDDDPAVHAPRDEVASR